MTALRSHVAHRCLAALALGDLTVAQLQMMLCAPENSVRYALDRLAKRRMVTLAGSRKQHRSGRIPHLWRRLHHA